jgi:hypothetical protein
MELTENRVWSTELSGLELVYIDVLQRYWRKLRNTYNAHVNNHRKDSRRYVPITNFKLLHYIFLPLEGTIQICCSLYNESLYCLCRVAFHWTRRPHVAADCHCSVLGTPKQPKARCEINLSYMLTEGMANGWLDKLLRICLIAEPWTDRQFGCQTGWLTERLSNRQTKIPAGWQTDRQTDRQTEWLTDHPTDLHTIRRGDCYRWTDLPSEVGLGWSIEWISDFLIDRSTTEWPTDRLANFSELNCHINFEGHIILKGWSCVACRHLANVTCVMA